MTRRPVQQARRITNKQLVPWPVREPIEWPPIRTDWVDILLLAIETVAFSLVLLALAFVLMVGIA